MDKELSYEEFLEKNDTLTYTCVGSSMLPLLREGKDLFVVTRKGKERCRRGDVVLYRRPPSHYVLHRIVQVREKDYVILGDNCINREYGITDGDIIGVMTGFVRNGREHQVKESAYRCYTALCLATSDARILYKKAVWRLKKLLHEK